MENLVDVLYRLPLFESCDDKELVEQLALQSHRLREKKKGEYIGRVGDEIDKAMILVERTVFTLMEYEDRNFILQDIKAPAFLAPSCTFQS